MRHRIHGRRLNRSSAHRTALRKNLVADLICHEQIVTTEAKARTIRPAAEKMITLAKRGLAKGQNNPIDEVHARRLAAARLPKTRVVEDDDGYFEEINVVKTFLKKLRLVSWTVLAGIPVWSKLANVPVTTPKWQY